MAITPGGRVGDASPLGKKGPRKLDDYVREVAHALMRKGYSKSHAIATARNSLKRWAAGRGKVRPQVRAAAGAATANQKRLDHVHLSNTLASSQDGPRGTVQSVAKIRPGSIPSGKGKGKYPIRTQRDVRAAASLLHKAKGVSRAKVVAHVRAEAKRRGLKLTPAFQSDHSLRLVRDVDLAGRWKHGWIPLDAEAAARHHGKKSRSGGVSVPSTASSRTKAVPSPKARAAVQTEAQRRSSRPPVTYPAGMDREKATKLLQDQAAERKRLSAEGKRLREQKAAIRAEAVRRAQADPNKVELKPGEPDYKGSPRTAVHVGGEHAGYVTKDEQRTQVLGRNSRIAVGTNVRKGWRSTGVDAVSGSSGGTFHRTKQQAVDEVVARHRQRKATDAELRGASTEALTSEVEAYHQRLRAGQYVTDGQRTRARLVEQELRRRGAK